jgi:Localisation of periplasmic protein complexes.
LFKKWILLLLFVSMPAVAGRITSFSIGYPVSHWELTFGLTNSPECQFFVIANPDRLVADCHGLNHKPDINFNELNNFPTPVSRIRVAMRPKNELRIVFDLKHPIYAGVSQGSKVMTIDLLPLPPNERHTRVDDVRSLSNSSPHHTTAQRYQLVSEKSQLDLANGERDIYNHHRVTNYGCY